jgi:hypothetical protein
MSYVSVKFYIKYGDKEIREPQQYTWTIDKDYIRKYGPILIFIQEDFYS